MEHVGRVRRHYGCDLTTRHQTANPLLAGATRGPRTWAARGWTWLNRTWWRKVGTVVAMIAAILSIGSFFGLGIDIWGDESEPIALGEEGASGALSLTPTELTCGKTVEDLPEELHELSGSGRK